MSTFTKSITLQINPGSGGTPRTIPNVPWYPGISALDVMIVADAMFDDTFTFRLVYKSLFGAWVDLIDDIEDTDSVFWIMYVNGASATQGVSSEIIPMPADNSPAILEWRFESFGHENEQAGTKMKMREA